MHGQVLLCCPVSGSGRIRVVQLRLGTSAFSRATSGWLLRAVGDESPSWCDLADGGPEGLLHAVVHGVIGDVRCCDPRSDVRCGRDGVVQRAVRTFAVHRRAIVAWDFHDLHDAPRAETRPVLMLGLLCARRCRVPLRPRVLRLLYSAAGCYVDPHDRWMVCRGAGQAACLRVHSPRVELALE